MQRTPASCRSGFASRVCVFGLAALFVTTGCGERLDRVVIHGGDSENELEGLDGDLEGERDGVEQDIELRDQDGCVLVCPDGYAKNAAGEELCQCARKPDCVCSKELRPVCGTDGVTYDNPCEAGCFGAGIQHEGACSAVCPALGCDPRCEWGQEIDPNGCPTCRCNPPPTCEPVDCNLACPDGFAKDEDGCMICECLHACPAIGCAEPCPGGYKVGADGCPTCECLPVTQNACERQGGTCTGMNANGQVRCPTGSQPSRQSGLCPSAAAPVCCVPIAVCGCPPEEAPVCGIDGVSYPNACEAGCAHVQIAYEGKCVPVQACGPDSPCPRGQRCLVPSGSTTGVCVDRTCPIMACDCMPGSRPVDYIGPDGCPACTCVSDAECATDAECPPDAYCELCPRRPDCPECSSCGPAVCSPRGTCDPRVQTCACDAARDCPAGYACTSTQCLTPPCPSFCKPVDCPPVACDLFCECGFVSDARGCATCECLPCGCSCPGIWAPVCGADGRTYGNSCEADCARVPVAYEGECRTATCADGRPCAPGQRCEACPYDPSCPLCEACPPAVCVPANDGCARHDTSGLCRCFDVSECPAGSRCEVRADEMLGRCVVSPDCTACPPVDAPVCGTNGTTYRSACEARCAGVEVAYDGACRGASCATMRCAPGMVCVDCPFDPSCPACDRCAPSVCAPAVEGCTTYDTSGQCVCFPTPDGQAACPAGYECAIASSDGMWGYCKPRQVTRCRADRDCPAGQSCQAGVCVGVTPTDCAASGGQCVPLGPFSTCPAGYENANGRAACPGVGAMCCLPCACPALNAPVCAADGRTYANACEARCAGASVIYDGACHDGSCTGPADCPAGEICDPAARVCKPQPTTCRTDRDCRPGTICDARRSVCVPEPIQGCNTTADCEAGLTCVAGACLAGCRSDAECPLGQICDAATSTCIPAGARDVCLQRGGTCAASAASCPTGTRGAGDPALTCPTTGNVCCMSCGCPTASRPVCGADGRTYQNACLAECAGVPVRFEGDCGSGCGRGGPCGPGMMCQNGACVPNAGAACGRDADCGGALVCINDTCQARPADCTRNPLSGDCVCGGPTNVSCPAGWVCGNLQCAFGVCVGTCEPMATPGCPPVDPCPAGCFPSVDPNGCLVGCACPATPPPDGTAP